MKSIRFDTIKSYTFLVHILFMGIIIAFKYIDAIIIISITLAYIALLVLLKREKKIDSIGIFSITLVLLFYTFGIFSVKHLLFAIVLLVFPLVFIQTLLFKQFRLFICVLLGGVFLISFKINATGARHTLWANPHFDVYDKNQAVTYTSYGDLGFVFNDRQNREITLFTDQFGNPNRTNQNEKSNGIFILGDSFSSPGAVSFNQLFPQIVSQSSRKQVYNFSQPGYSPWQEFIWFKSQVKNITKCENQTVVWQLFSGNDLTDYYDDYDQIDQLKISMFSRLSMLINGIRYRDKMHLLWSGEFAENDSERYRELIRTDIVNGHKYYFREKYVTNASLSLADVQDHYNAEAFKKTLQQALEYFAVNNVHVIILLIPTKYEVLNHVDQQSGFSQYVQRTLERQNKPYTFIDAKTALIQESDYLLEHHGSTVFWRDDTHLNPEGHKVLAKLICENI